MKNKVVLFYPRTAPTGKWCRVPLSLLAIARSLEGKYEIKIIDGMVDRDYEKKVMDSMSDAVCLGISSMTGYQIQDGLRIAKLVKREFPQIPIIWGGWHVSILPRQSIMNSYVDIIARGQGEITFPELVSKLENNEPLDSVLGITYKRGDKIIENADRPLVDVNNFPPLPYQLIDVEKYINQTLNTRTINYLSSIGCPHRCGFCVNFSVYGRRWFGLKATEVLDELESLVKQYNINGIVFEDSIFFVDKKRVKQICEGIIERGLNIKWHANGRTEHVITFGDELLSLIKKSGCQRILVGAESGSSEVMELITKDATVKDTLEFAEICKKHSIIGEFSMMVCFPGQPEEDFYMTMDLIKKIRAIYDKHEILVFFYTPYPGTPLYEKSIIYGFQEPESLEEWSNFDLRVAHAPWVNGKKFEKIISFYLPLAYPNFVKRLNPLSSVIFTFLHYLARFRMKHNFFRFPFEWVIYKKIEKRLGISWVTKS
jgi:radical SAM superfamily enzyme YgiQ (UPF0313 family)